MTFTPIISDLCTAQQMKLAVKLSTFDYLSFKSMNNFGDFRDSLVLYFSHSAKAKAIHPIKCVFVWIC